MNPLQAPLGAVVEDETLRIGSLNVDALSSRAHSNKVVMVSALIHTLNLDILMIQDTHVANRSPEEMELIRYNSLLDIANHCPVTGTKGVMTIINKRRTCFLNKALVADPDGRLLISVVFHKNKSITKPTSTSPQNHQGGWNGQRT